MGHRRGDVCCTGAGDLVLGGEPGRPETVSAGEDGDGDGQVVGDRGPVPRRVRSVPRGGVPLDRRAGTPAPPCERLARDSSLPLQPLSLEDADDDDDQEDDQEEVDEAAGQGDDQPAEQPEDDEDDHQGLKRVSGHGRFVPSGIVEGDVDRTYQRPIRGDRPMLGGPSAALPMNGTYPPAVAGLGGFRIG